MKTKISHISEQLLNQHHSRSNLIWPQFIRIDINPYCAIYHCYVPGWWMDWPDKINVWLPFHGRTLRHLWTEALVISLKPHCWWQYYKTCPGLSECSTIFHVTPAWGCLTWAPRSLTSSTDQRPSYWIHTKMPPSVSHVASFWKGSFQRTKTTCHGDTDTHTNIILTI